jgi:hypothetical protein
MRPTAKSTARKPELDAAMFDNRANATNVPIPLLIRGDWFSANRSTLSLVNGGPKSVILGTPLCIGGAFSGERCMGKTKAFLGDVSVPVVGNVESMLLVSSAPQDQSNFSNVLAGAGDSGGPGFFQYTGSNGVDYINPIGILSATYGGRPGICAGENARRKCSSEVLTVPIYDVLKALNATLYIY